MRKMHQPVSTNHLYGRGALSKALPGRLSCPIPLIFEHSEKCYLISAPVWYSVKCSLVSYFVMIMTLFSSYFQQLNKNYGLCVVLESIIFSKCII